MDINKAFAMINLMNAHPSGPKVTPTSNTQEVDLDYIIYNKPPIKIVRQYFEENIENLEESE